MGDSWYHRTQALDATDAASACRAAARRLRSLAADVAIAVDAVPPAMDTDTWESPRADAWRRELARADAALGDAASELEWQATVLDQTARSHDSSSDWHWRRYHVALDNEAEAAVGAPS